MDHKSTLKLPKRLTAQLTKLPEQGMGYPVIDLRLKSGKWLTRKIVLNAEDLVIDSGESVHARDISEVQIHVE